jgi:hypothetical protein
MFGGAVFEAIEVKGCSRLNFEAGPSILEGNIVCTTYVNIFFCTFYLGQ